jgi:hypothetical protein
MISSSEGIRGGRKHESWVVTLARKFRSASYEAGPSHQEGNAHNTAIEYCTFRPRIFRRHFSRSELSTAQSSFSIGIPLTKTNTIFLALTHMLMRIQVSLNTFRIQKIKEELFFDFLDSEYWGSKLFRKVFKPAWPNIQSVSRSNTKAVDRIFRVPVVMG